MLQNESKSNPHANEPNLQHGKCAQRWSTPEDSCIDICGDLVHSPSKRCFLAGRAEVKHASAEPTKPARSSVDAAAAVGVLTADSGDMGMVVHSRVEGLCQLVLAQGVWMGGARVWMGGVGRGGADGRLAAHFLTLRSTFIRSSPPHVYSMASVCGSSP